MHKSLLILKLTEGNAPNCTFSTHPAPTAGKIVYSELI